MKLVVIFSVLFFLSAASQETKMKLKGIIKNNSATELMIKTPEDKLVAVLPIKHNRVNGLVEKSPGTYRMMIGSEYTDLYVSNGTLSFVVDLSAFDESLQYEGSLANENNYLAARLLKMEKFRDAKMYYDKEVHVFLDSLNTLYRFFDTLLNNPLLNLEFKRKQIVQNRIERFNKMMMYAEYHPYLTKKEKFVLPDSYYSFLNQINLNDRENTTNKDYIALINQYFSYLFKKGNSTDAVLDVDKAAIGKLALLREKVHLAELRDAIVRNEYAYVMKSSNLVNEMAVAYMQTAISDRLKKEVEEYSFRLRKFNVGSPAPDFSLINDKGQKKSLSDYKGKYLYLDIWATWCGPCRKELPHYEELKSQYKNQNIEFVSICVWDQKEQWENFLKEKKLGGEQLFNPQEDLKFVENYMIQGVPTFVLIDKEGKLLVRSAERPSEAALKNRLDTLLK